MCRTKTMVKTIKHQNVHFNDNRSMLEARFDLNNPHCFTITSYLFFTTEEEDAPRILSSITNRFRTYIKFNMCCEKEINIIDYPSKIEQGEKFCIQVEYAGLNKEKMTKSLLLDKAETMAMLLEEFTRTLNSNMIILTKSLRGNRKKDKK